MDNRSVETELFELETRYWTAIMEKDAVAALHLSHDRCVLTGAQGACKVDPASLREVMDAAPWMLDEFELQGLQVNLVEDDVAIVSYKVKESLIVEGRPLGIEAVDTSTWVRSDGRWLCARHAMA